MGGVLFTRGEKYVRKHKRGLQIETLRLVFAAISEANLDGWRLLMKYDILSFLTFMKKRYRVSI